MGLGSFLGGTGGKILGTALGSAIGMPMLGSMVGSIGGSMLGGKLDGSPSGDAAKAGMAGLSEAGALQKYIYDTTRKDYSPFMQTGSLATMRLRDLMGLGTGTPFTSYDQFKSGVSPLYASNKAGTAGKDLYYDPTTGAVSTSGDPNYKTGIMTQTSADGLGADTQSAWDRITSKAKGGDFGSLTQPFSLDKFQADPSYNFRLSEGTKALERGAASRGMTFSPSTMKALERYSQDTASQEYGNAYNRYNSDQGNLYNRLSGLAGSGQQAVGGVSAIGSDYARNMGNIYTAQGDLRGAGILGRADEKNQMFGDALSMFGGGGGSFNLADLFKGGGGSFANPNIAGTSYLLS